MANEYIWVDANEREVQVSGPATAAFEAGYTDKQIGAHASADPLDHPDGSVNLDKLDDGVKDYFAKKSNTDAHIASKANPHGVTKTQVGLGNADNTADMDKPISTAMRAALDTKQEKEAGKGLSAENYTAAEKEKLAGVEAGANAYTHPQTHAAAMIEQDDSHRFVTAAEKETWNAKAAPEDIRAGENVNVSVANGKVTISATGGGEGGGVTVADDLTSTSPVSALSANQGRVLNEKIDELNGDLENQISAKADVSHEHTSADISDFPTLCEGDNIVFMREGTDLTISAPSVDDKLTADDIVAGENITLEKADGSRQVKVSASVGGIQSGRSEYLCNHSVGTYTNTIPVPEGMNYALVFITNRKRTSDELGELFGIMCYINKSLNDVVVMGNVGAIDKYGMWRYSTNNFVTGKMAYGSSNYTLGSIALGAGNSHLTEMVLTEDAITMTVNVTYAEDGDKTGRGYVVDWTVWK